MEKFLLGQIDDTLQKDTTFKYWFYLFKQWLYRGQRPNWIAKMLNRVSAVLASRNATSNGTVALVVVGRK